MEKGKGPVVVSVINLKGGVGKSTIAVLLSRFAAEQGRKVLAVDLDPQANLSQAFMRSVYRKFLKDKDPSIVEVFRGYRPPSSSGGSPRPLDPADVVRRVGSGAGISLVPSRFDFADNLVKSLKPDPRTLARFLSDLPHDPDMVFVDCAPTESIFTQAAYGASRYVLVPVRPEYFATIGFPLLEQSLADYKHENRGHAIDVIGVVINNAFYDGGNDGGPETREALKEIRLEAAKNGWHVFTNELRHSRGFPKMMRGKFTHLGNAWSDFRRFGEEFIQRLDNLERGMTP